MFNLKNNRSEHFRNVVCNVGLSILSTACVGACVSAAPGWTAPLQNWRFDPTTNQLEVLVSEGIKPRYFLMAQPARLVLDLPETEVGAVPISTAFNGAVQEVRVSQFQPGIARIVLVLSPDVVLANEQAQLQQVQDSDPISDRWILRPLIATATSGSMPSSMPTVSRPSSLPPELQNALPPAPPASASGVAPAPVSASLPAAAPVTMNRSNLMLSQVNPSLAIPNELPPARPPEASSIPTVTVPPLERAVPNRSPANNAVPALPSSAIAPRSQPMPRPTTIEFGQPLPNQPSNQSIVLRRSTPTPQTISLSSGVILPTGTNLLLQYPGNEPLQLQGNQSRPEVLRLQSEIRDRSGRLVASPGTPVFGRFETNREGSRFIAEAIAVQGQNVSLIGRSDRLGGSRQVSENRLIRNSGIGALAGAILGGLSGGNVIGGAALGAGATYVLAPKPATIQPGQVISVQLVEDFR